jgi:hypothetical protein
MLRSECSGGVVHSVRDEHIMLHAELRHTCPAFLQERARNAMHAVSCSVNLTLHGHLTCLQQVASAVGHAVLLYAVVSPPHVLHPSGGAAIATLSAVSEITHPLAMLDFEIDRSGR